jgi:hypothetical protein
MNKSRMLKILNPIVAVLFLNQLGTGFFRGALSHETFEVLHEGGAIVFAIAVAAHVALNWNWVRASFGAK